MPQAGSESGIFQTSVYIVLGNAESSFFGGNYILASRTGVHHADGLLAGGNLWQGPKSQNSKSWNFIGFRWFTVTLPPDALAGTCCSPLASPPPAYYFFNMEALRKGCPAPPVPPLYRPVALLLLMLAWMGLPTVARADALSDATDKLRSGDYDGAYTTAAQAIKDTYPSESLVAVEAQALLAVGRYNDAYAATVTGLRTQTDSIRLRLLYRTACLYTGKDTEALKALADIDSAMAILAQRQQILQTPLDAQTLTDAGEGALLLKMDPKTIIERFFDPAMQGKPAVHDSFVEAGRLALDKHDFQLASLDFGNGLKAFPGDADMLAGLAEAFRDSDREKFADYAQQAITANPRHVPTLLLLAENLIDAEQHDQARELLNKILTINPKEPGAFALLAVLSYLHNQPEQAAAYRTQALSTWGKNPQVDFLIGQKLSQNYRFTLGADEQRKALASDPTYTRARVQLAQDLLRLGQEEEGWSQAAQAHKEDGYDVEAFNLVSLDDEISKYKTISNGHFNLRMEPQEAQIYGPRVMALLEKERNIMPAKYGLDLTTPVLVEIFPNAADFSVRTFSMPDIGEFLGVTFGNVVTINSPGTHESNWPDVIWHEFTHVVTLTLTRNQMPRWLSEGISVYEENQGDPAWGIHMDPDFCGRILAGKMQPISSMSAAFLKAKNSTDTQFAYFEAELVVQYFMDHYSIDHVKTLLQDIGKGMEFNDALAKNFAPVTQLDEDFVKYAQDQAKKYAGDWNFSKPEEPGASPATVTIASDAAGQSATVTPAKVADPHNYYSRIEEIEKLLEAEDWEKARDQIKEINATGIYAPGPDNPYLMLAHVCDKLHDPAGEKEALTMVASHEADSLAAISRLLEIARNDKDYAAMAKWGEASIEIHPLGVTAWRALLDAHEERKENVAGIEAGLALINLDPPDLASLHYRVAKMMLPTDPVAARRHVLQALEEAPRFRAAYDLLAALPTTPVAAAPTATPTPATP